MTSTSSCRHIWILRLSGIALFALVFLLSSCALFRSYQPDAKPEPVAAAKHILVLGDSHYPGKYPENKEAVIRSINGWPDVALVAVVGDLNEDIGRPKEYEASKAYFGNLQKPAAFVVGNHDYWYEDTKGEINQRVMAGTQTRQEKLDRFRAAFEMKELYYSKRLGGYLLIFLSTDHLESRDFAEMSSAQVDWFKAELERNRDLPTIVFFHAPLQGTLESYDVPKFVAKPDDIIEHFLAANPQVFLWVSGHVHLSVRSASYPGGDKLFLGRVRSVSCPDMNRRTIWTTSLYLYPDRVEVRTWNHRWGFWESQKDLIVASPINAKP
jgi:predicted MPP superfamily phosphohydrolase